MFSRTLNNLKKRLNFRLSFIFSALFVASFLILFALTYLMLSSSLHMEDRETMRLKLLELWSQYQMGGIPRLRLELAGRGPTADDEIVLIRVAERSGRTLLLAVPENWDLSGIESLISAVPPEPSKSATITLKGRRSKLELSSILLSDGNILQVGMDVTSREYLLSRIRIIFAFGMIPLVFLSFVTGSLLAARSLRPITRLSSAARSIIETGRIDARLPTRGGRDELDDLVLLFNRMLEKIEVLVRGMREALDTVAHDLRTPMTRLRGTAEIALQEPDNPSSLREALNDCLEESEQILTMLNTLMDISDAESGAMNLNLEDTALFPLVRDCAEITQYVADGKGIEIRNAVPRGLSVVADSGRLRQTLLNLLDNAVKYNSNGGSVEVSAHENPTSITLTVSDSGRGIKEDELDQIWNRLYRGAAQRSTPGLGLGLSLVRAIAVAHGGTVDVQSKPGKGSSFSIILPKKAPL
jgi:signal transduction histidine kinase